MQQDYLMLGRLARPHAIQGEIRVNWFAESPLLLDLPLWLRAGKESPRPARILSWRLWRDQPVIRLEGISDRTRAEELRGQELLIAAKDLPPSEKDEPYILDLLDLPVRLSANGELIGHLAEVLFPADQELWSILSPEGQEILFPAVPEYVDDIDLDKGQIFISPPPGLLEIYLKPAS